MAHTGSLDLHVKKLERSQAQASRACRQPSAGNARVTLACQLAAEEECALSTCEPKSKTLSSDFERMSLLRLAFADQKTEAK